MRALGRLGAMRTRATSRMESRVTVRRETGTRAEQDETSGLEVAGWQDIHVEIPARIGGSAGASASRNENEAGGDQRVGSRVLHLPADTDDLADGDHVEVVAGEHVGTVWRIVEADPADQQTARRVPVVATERPEGWVS